MLRRFLDFQLSFFEKGKPLAKLRPFVSAADAFCFEAPLNTKNTPYIRDSVDAKRWMVLVIFALLPAIFMAFWNTGFQKIVYGSGDFHFMNEYLKASDSFSGYFHFVTNNHLYLSILKAGIGAFLPIMLISYVVGGTIEGLVASIRGHEIAEGFL